MKKPKKIILIVLIIIIAIIVILFTLLQLGVFNGIMKNFIVSAANKSLNAQLEIGSINGNPLNKLEINNIRLKTKTETLLFIPKLRYKLVLSKIFKKRIQLDFVEINSMEMHLVQSDDGVWNFANIAIPDTVSKDKPKTNAKNGLNWDFVLDKFALNNAVIYIASADSVINIPKRIENFNIQSSQSFIDGKLKFALEEFRLKTIEPYNHIDLHLNVSQAGNVYRLSDFVCKTKSSEIVIEAEGTNSPSGKIKLNINPLTTAEIREFIPDLQFFGNPNISIEASYIDDIINAHVSVIENMQSIDLYAEASSLTKNPEYKLNTILKNIDLSNWTNNSEMESDINGKIIVIGKNTGPEDIEANVKFILTDSQFAQRKINSMNLEVTKLKENADILLNVKSDYGSVDISGKVNNIFHIPEFDLNCQIRELDVAPIIMNDELVSNINLNCHFSGSGTNQEELIADLDLLLFSSNIMDVPLDTLLVQVSYDKQNYKINNFYLGNAVADVNASGHGLIQENNDVTFRIELKDLSLIKNMFNADILEAEGFVAGSIEGKADALKTKLNIDLKNIQFNNIKTESLTFSAEVDLIQNEFSGNIQADIHNTDLEQFSIDSISLKSDFSQTEANPELLITFSDSLSLELKSLLSYAEKEYVVHLPMFKFNSNLENWSGGSDSMKVVVSDNRFMFTDFELASEDQYLRADGLLDLGGESDFQFDLHNLSLSKFSELADASIGGSLSMAVKLKGNLEKPEIIANIALENPKFNEVELHKFELTSNFKNDSLNVDFGLFRTVQESLSGSAFIPLSLSKKNPEINKDAQLVAELYSDGIDISFVQEFIPQISKLAGIFRTNLKLQNTLSSPEVSGNISLLNGKVVVPEFGINYDYELLAEAKKDEITLEKLELISTKGKLNVTGDVKFEDNITSKVIDFGLSAKADNFYLANSKDVQLVIDFDANAQGPLEKPTFDGKLTVLRTLVNIDAFIDRKASKSPYHPLLVQALRDTTQTIQDEKKKKSKALESKLISNLRGKFNVSIPKNSWIRGNDMNVEIAGDIQVLKNSKDFELYGEVKIIRGNYTLYGRRFNLKDGSVSFTGGSELNAVLDLKLGYDLYDANREMRSLMILVTGNAKSPKIDFTLDNQRIEEKDAISYLLFGKSSDAMSMGENYEMNKTTDAMGTATNILAKQISGKVTKTIGKALNLDVIEFKGSDNWQNADIVVGKYITNNLFVSYQKEFNISSSSQLTTEKVTMEYEIFKNIIIQANQGDRSSSGYDIYFKYNK
ncbi:MAG: hypothetical protein CVU48_08955 [Candidatus Cloacimonetes bacterium HGW-Cloacimonetes-1]|jgi:translocation and assembly module TamB|nr:MAG: hypothetical protein CVU48_08955 [Candidatus Cloacimonetes bacterium HGW-Cloacimonetes-1]